MHFFSGSTTGKVVQDSSLRSGEQTVAIGKELASVVLVGGVAYISGNGQGMTSYFGLPTALGPTLAGRWISVQPADSQFRADHGERRPGVGPGQRHPFGPVDHGQTFEGERAGR